MPNPPPAPGQKKRGLGCCGCGCIILAILGVLALGLLGGGGYFLYHGALDLTSPTAANIPTFDGGDDVYNGAKQKIDTFNQNVQQNQPASLHLSADEINTLIARNPDLGRQNIHVFVTITDDQAGAQVSYPGSLTPLSFLKGRYLNGEAAIGLSFDTDTRTLHVSVQSCKLGRKTVPDADLPLVESEINPAINAGFQKDPYFKNIFDHAKAIEIKHSELVVDTQ